MPTLLELEPQALALSESERVQLISSLLISLPANEEDEDADSATIALRREKEAEADPSLIISEEEFWEGVSNWRSRDP